VTAVDLDPRFVRGDPRPNLEVIAADVLAEPLPGGNYDLVHVRALLMHLPGATRLLGALLATLRPDGLLLVEEGDCYPLDTATSAGYTEACRRCVDVVAARGGDWTWARRLPGELVAAGSVDVGTRCVTPMFPGGSGLAEFMSLSFEQVEPLLVAGGLTPAALAAVAAELADPDHWFPFLAMHSGWSRRPA
jgi:SAM-dependent methyltransferase